MMILFVVLSFVMVFILIWQQIQHKKLVREIDYITSRLDTISVISENGFVLIPTDNDSIKKLSAALNKLLQDFYTKKSQFEQSKQAMAKVLTNISHDIRTPLTVLKGNSEMLSNITNTYSASENVHISKGAIYGFVGPNGAGKSTVMKMILSLIQPDAGEVQLLGEKVTSHS